MISADIHYLHGSTPLDFLLGDLDVYVTPYDGTVVEHYVGQTEAEKTFSPSIEYAEWFTGMPNVLYIKRAKKVGYSMKFSFKQVGDPTILGLALNGENIYTDPGADLVYMGSDPPAPLECRWRFVGNLVDGRYIQLVIRRGIIANPEDFVTGSGDYTNVPVTVEALVDENICDKQRNLVFICVERLAIPSGGFPDPCPASDEPACDPD